MRRSQLVLAVLGVVWVTTVAHGMAVMWRYEYVPGASATPPAEWPQDSRLVREPERATLVMPVHPRCPCTRASIGELARLMTRLRGRLTAHVLLLKPPGTPEAWEKTDLWRRAAAIPGVTVDVDEDGAEARRFGAVRSGQVVLYDEAGSLLFSGGITPSRGHAGDSQGRAVIVALVVGERTDRHRTPVFGCSLVTQNEPCGTR